MSGAPPPRSPSRLAGFTREGSISSAPPFGNAVTVAEPSLVYCYKREKNRLLERVEGDIVLGESPLDPVIDIPVRRLVDISWSERATIQTAEIHSKVPGDWVLPFVHQRYDDLSVLGKAD